MKTQPLRLVAEVTLGQMRNPVSELGSNQLPYLRAANVKNGGLALTDIKQMHFGRAEQMRYSLRRDDVLVTEASGSRSQVGQTAMWDGSIPRAAFQNTLVRLRARSGTDPRFLYWWSRHAYESGLYSAVSQGLAIWHLSAERIRALPFPSVLLASDQRRIADFLDDQVQVLERAVAARTRQAGLVDERLATETEEVITRLSLAHGTRRLGRSILAIEQGWSPDCDAVPADAQEWGVLKVSAVRPGLFRPEENKRLPAQLAPRLQYRVRPGELLVTRANTPNLVGQFAVVPSGTPDNLLLCDKIMRVRLASATSVDFVSLVASDRRSRQHFTAASSGTSQSMVNVRGEDVRSLTIPHPPLNVQDQVVQQLRAQQAHVSRSIDAFNLQSALLRERKQALITAAVTGQFDVTTARKVSTT